MSINLTFFVFEYKIKIMKRKRKHPQKTCPRCHLTMPEAAETCPDCGLSFDRLEIATNKDAKRKILRGDRDYIIRVRKIPSDVKYYKLLLIAIFLGFFGGHCYYVGRYLRGVMLTTNAVVGIFCVIFNSFFLSLWNGLLMEILGVIIGVFVLVWFFDLWLILFKKFKIPLAIDLKDDEVIK